MTNCVNCGAVDRLAEYENTGLSPKEIRELIEKTNKGGDV